MQENKFTEVLLQLDAPISIELPPKETKSSDRRRALQQPRSSARNTPCSNSYAASTSVKRGRSVAVTADYLASWRNRAVTIGCVSFFLFCVLLHRCLLHGEFCHISQYAICLINTQKLHQFLIGILHVHTNFPWISCAFVYRRGGVMFTDKSPTQPDFVKLLFCCCDASNNFMTGWFI